MKRYLTNVLRYFAFFSYTPTFEEIFMFFPVKITKKSLHTLLISSSSHYSLTTLRLRSGQANHSLHTLPQYSIAAGDKSQYNKLKPTSLCHSREGGNPDYKFQYKNSNHRLDPLLRGDDNTRRIQLYIWLLKWLPLVRFVGITGKSAMEGIRKHDDVDLFIITRSKLIWTTRFFVVLGAKLLRIHGGTGFCLNLFFDEQDLMIPKRKQNEYIAHEMLQMKPIIDKQNTYSLLMEANKWIFEFFPNVRRQKTEDRRQKNTFLLLTSIFFLLEKMMKSLQLPIIKKNKTDFSITPTQLWLFKQDFEKKIHHIV